MSYTKTTWAAGDKVTSAKLNNIENGIEAVESAITNVNDVATANSGTLETVVADYSALNEQVQQNVEVINDNASVLDDAVGEVASLSAKLAVLEDKVDALRKTNVTPKAVTANEFATGGAKATDNSLTVNAADQDLVVTLDAPMNNQFLNVVAQSLTAKDMEMKSSKFNANVEGDIAISGLTTSGNLPKATSNAMMSFESPEYVTIKDSTLGETGYNCVEIGLSKKDSNNNRIVPKGVLIENINFTGTCSNNAISVFGAQDNAIITVKDCTFNKVSNAFRWSNDTNSTGVVINFINCDFIDVEDSLEYHAVMLCQDWLSAAAEIDTNNRFAPEKLTVNFINCKYEGKDLVAVDDISTICNSKTADQLVYTYFDHGTPAGPGYDATKCPVINIK